MHRLRAHGAADQHVDLRHRVRRQAAQRRLERLLVAAAARVDAGLSIFTWSSRRCRSIGRPVLVPTWSVKPLAQPRVHRDIDAVPVVWSRSGPKSVSNVM